MTTPAIALEAKTVTALRQVLDAATVAEIRHPHCGAFAYLRQALAELPPDLRSAIGDLPAHPEDDAEDGRAEVARLVRENRDLRRQLNASAAGQQAELWSAS